LLAKRRQPEHWTAHGTLHHHAHATLHHWTMTSTTEPTPTVFFCHIMKTGGTSFRRMLWQIFRQDEVAPYLPNHSPEERLIFNVINPFLLGEPAPTERVRVVAAHYPFATRELMRPPVKTLALLRDPIDRAVSYLRHIQRDTYPHRSYEDLYSDPAIFDAYLYNLQARTFVFESRTAKTLMERTFDWNDDLLARAMHNVAELDVIGLTTEYDVFVRNVESELGWKFREVLREHSAPTNQAPVPQSLRERMRVDLDYDVRFYAHARQVYLEREKARANRMKGLTP
jgi:hypothetical protein